MIDVEDLSKRYGDKLAVPSSSDSREARLPAPVESFTISTSTRHVRRLPIPAAWQARSSRTVREWAVVPAGLAPVLLTGACLVADILQRASYSPMRQTMSVMAGQAGTDGQLRMSVEAASRIVLSATTGAALSLISQPDPVRGRNVRDAVARGSDRMDHRAPRRHVRDSPARTRGRAHDRERGGNAQQQACRRGHAADRA
jgi:hypothetical protein